MQPPDSALEVEVGVRVLGPLDSGFAAEGVELILSRAEFDATDLARDRLRQLGELESADPLVGGEVLPAVREDRARGLGIGLEPAADDDVALGDGGTDRTGGGTTAASATASCSMSTLSSSNGESR